MSTKDKILDAAETLFAEHGFEGTSLREITALASVNLAAINYHFRSKDALIRAVYGRRIGAVNERRLTMLDAFEAEAAGGVLPLNAVLQAFYAPVFEVLRDLGPKAQCLGLLMGRIYVEPSETVHEILREQITQIAQRFVSAFHRALPHLPIIELIWRVNFCVGVLSHSLAGTRQLQVVSGGQCDPSDMSGMLERVISFVGAGLRAPLPALPPRS